MSNAGGDVAKPVTSNAAWGSRWEDVWWEGVGRRDGSLVAGGRVVWKEWTRRVGRGRLRSRSPLRRASRVFGQTSQKVVAGVSSAMVEKTLLMERALLSPCGKACEEESAAG